MILTENFGLNCSTNENMSEITEYILANKIKK